jgi:DNA-binding transcriptional regulator of glucitol operon
MRKIKEFVQRHESGIIRFLLIAQAVLGLWQITDGRYETALDTFVILYFMAMFVHSSDMCRRAVDAYADLFSNLSIKARMAEERGGIFVVSRTEDENTLKLDIISK